MKSLQFSVPANTNKSISIQEDIMTHFYPYFHSHDETQIMWIVKGHGTLAIEQNLLNFSDGDIFTWVLIKLTFSKQILRKMKSTSSCNFYFL
jgi:gentisate 1,2-dioxygenase